MTTVIIVVGICVVVLAIIWDYVSKMIDRLIGGPPGEEE